MWSFAQACVIEERAHVQLRVKKMQQLALGSTSQHTCTCIGCERIAAELEGSKEGALAGSSIACIYEKCIAVETPVVS